MRKLLRQREIVADDWRYAGEPGAESAEAVIVPVAELRADAARWTGSSRFATVTWSPGTARRWPSQRPRR